MIKWIISLALVAACAVCGAEVDYTRAAPPVEFRGIWVNADAIPKTESGVRELVRSYARAHLNVLLPEVVARGYTVYPSKILARDPRFAGACDPLPPMIDEAHKLGLEVHPWVWVFRAGYTKDRGGILTAHPDWAERGKNGEELSPNGGLWVSPAIPAARDFLAALYAELVSKYNVDGLHLDYIRYEVERPIPYGYGDASRAQFEREYGIDPLNIDRLTYNQISWNGYRERLVNTFVQRIALQTRRIKPCAKISAAVGSDPTSSGLTLMQNWQNWIDNKWVDFVTPMAYTADNKAFARMVTAQRDAVGNRTILAPGIGLHMQKDSVDTTVAQVGIARELLAQGQTMFASSYFGEPQQSALASGPYLLPAIVPYADPCAINAALTQAECKQPEFASYYSSLAKTLSDYAAYRSADIGYVIPSEPPLKLPEYVIPIPTVEISRATGEIKIDGKIDEPAWNSAAKIELKYTPTGDSAPQSTLVKLAYDSQNLYVAFRATEPDIDKIKASVTKRDGPVFYDDSAEIFVDPTAKRSEYYHLSANTIGTQFDQRVLSPSWNADWQTAGSIGNGEWIIEMAIPFASLGTSTPSPGTQWAINFTRNRTTSGTTEYITWSVPYGSFHSPDRFGQIVFK